MQIKFFFNTISVIFVLIGCTVKPIYHENIDEKISKLKNVEILPISGMNGYMLREKLVRILELNDIDPIYYTLEINYNKDMKNIAFENSGTIVRLNNFFSANFVLRDIEKKKILCAENVRLLNGFDAMRSLYAESVAENKSTDNGLTEIARLIHIKIINCLIQK